MQPGETITPGTQPQPQDQQLEQDPITSEPEQPSPVAPVTPEPSQITPQPQIATEVEAQPTWQFKYDREGQPVQETEIPPSATVNWTASEYVAHDKNISWFILVMLASVGVAGIIYLITRDRISPVVVIVLGGAFAAFGARKPQVLEYSINNTGVRIGQKQYPYGMFRTFSTIEEGAMRSILLMPLQRFNLPISVYYDPAEEQQIIEALATYLPHEERSISMIDNFMRKIRF